MVTTRVTYGQVEDISGKPWDISWDFGMGTRIPLYRRIAFANLHGGLSIRGTIIDDEGFASIGIYGASGVDLEIIPDIRVFAEAEWIAYSDRGDFVVEYLNVSGKGLRFGVAFDLPTPSR